jgi:hypothetical protein
MYALSSLEHIFRRPASCAINCRCCPIAIPRSRSTCSGHRAPIASHAVSWTDGVRLRPSFQAALRWRGTTCPVRGQIVPWHSHAADVRPRLSTSTLSHMWAPCTRTGRPFGGKAFAGTGCAVTRRWTPREQRAAGRMACGAARGPLPVQVLPARSSSTPFTVLERRCSMPGPEAICQQIRAVLEHEPRLDLHRYPIRLHCEDGIVTVDGDADTSSPKNLCSSGPRPSTPSGAIRVRTRRVRVRGATSEPWPLFTSTLLGCHGPVTPTRQVKHWSYCVEHCANFQGALPAARTERRWPAGWCGVLSPNLVRQHRWNFRFCKDFSS